MTKIVNLDALVTRRDKVIVLGGEEHVMATFTVKDYIHQMKTGEKINEMVKEASVDNAIAVLELTLEALGKAFPTIPQDALMGLSLPQLTALRELTEDMNTAEAAGDDLSKVEVEDDQGEATGEPE